MRKYLRPLVVVSFLLMFVAPVAVSAAVPSGSLIKASGQAVYYVKDGKRYVFPNERIFFSWYQDFSSVTVVTDTDLAGYPLGGNVTYRPGAQMVKLQTDPKVYVVAPGGVLRPIASESVAFSLFGAGWNRKIDDLSDAYFFDYKVGAAVVTATDYDLAAAQAVKSIDDDLDSRGAATPVVTQDFTAVNLGTWNDPKTWSAKSRPTAGAKVVIPPGVKVIFDAASTPELKSVDVQGELDFWAAGRTSLNLSAKTIKVSGVLDIGSAATPWPANLTASLDLTGQSSAVDAESGLTVANGGLVELVGAPVMTAWTTLAAPAAKGDLQLALAAKVADWPVGGRVLVTSTSRNRQESEVRTITKVDGANVSLDSGLGFSHAADPFLAAEVALLDRNVSITGAGGGVGGHVAVTAGGRLKLTNVALRGLGQPGDVGASALVFDGVGDASTSIVSKIVIEDSSNRCVTARYSDRLAVADSVFYRVQGPCLVGETGAESGLTFRRNLIASVAPGSAATADLVPAGVLLHNPDATVENNVVAGSDGMGYWYWLKNEITRPDGRKFQPRETPLGSFSGNAVQAAAKSGLFVDDVDGKSDYAPSAKAVFTGLRAVQSGDYGFWARGNGLEVSGAFLGDNRVGGSFAAFGATFKDSTVQGDPDSASSTLVSQAGFVYQDGPVNVSGVTFKNLLSTPKRSFSAFSWREKNDLLTDPLNAYRNIKLVNAQEWLAATPTTAAEQMSVVRDLDAGKTVTPKSDFLNFGCNPASGNVQNCPDTYAQLQVALREASSTRNVALERQDGKGIVRLEPGNAFDGVYAYFTVAEGEAYRLTAPDATSLSLNYSGATKPLDIRLAVGGDYQVSQSLGSTWTYDQAKGEVDLKIVPGDYVNVQW